ncbi:MAG TPA: hypothetical protein VHB02_08790 [Acidimicrobiales bacterium]|nr:hypothetical protein [Acidimicrobiales bacterium]
MAIVEQEVARTNPRIRLRGAPGIQMLDTATVEAIPWTDSDTFPGMSYKYLKVDLGTGFDITLMKIQRGVQLPVHVHYSETAMYCIKGRFSYEPAGSIGAGGFGFEPYGIIHEPDAATEEETIVLLINFASGLVQLYNEDGTPGVISHVELLLKEARRKNGDAAIAHLNLPDHIWD